MLPASDGMQLLFRVCYNLQQDVDTFIWLMRPFHQFKMQILFKVWLHNQEMSKWYCV